MRVCRIAVIGAFVVSLGACNWLEASREFNHGISYYKDENFDAAVVSFERASKAREDPAILYNLALARLALLRDDAKVEGSSAEPQREQVAAALAAIASARKLPDPTDSMLAKLGYIEGSVHALAGDEGAARSAFEASLEADPDFKPTLKALLELEPDAGSATARLVLATADVEALQPEEKLKP